MEPKNKSQRRTAVRFASKDLPAGLVLIDGKAYLTPRLAELDPLAAGIAPYIDHPAETFPIENLGEWADLEKEEPIKNEAGEVLGYTDGDGPVRRRLSRMGIEKRNWQNLAPSTRREIIDNWMPVLRMIEVAIELVINAGTPSSPLGEEKISASVTPFLRRMYNVYYSEAGNPGGFIQSLGRRFYQAWTVDARNKLVAELEIIRSEGKGRRSKTFMDPVWCGRNAERINNLLRSMNATPVCGSGDIQRLHRQTAKAIAADLLMDAGPGIDRDAAEGRPNRRG